MSFLDELIKVSISTETTQVSRAGFGTALILGCHTKFTELVRLYTGTDGMVADGFSSADPEYKAAAALFAQNPRPASVLVGRRTRLPTMAWKITPVVRNSTKYGVVVNGTAYEFTSDATATLAEILAGLKALINAATAAHGLTADDASGTHLALTASVAGAWKRVAVSDINLLAIVQNHANPGVETDLADIWLVDKQWYTLILTTARALEVAAAALWVETNKRLFVVASQDTGIVGSGTADIASTLKTAAYARTAVLFHPDNGVFADAAWDGKCLPLDPGSETWMFKTLAAVPAVGLTPAQVANAEGKNANTYVTVGGVNITMPGKTASGEWVDITRGVDWLAARLQERTFGALANAKKVPYTAKGIGVVENDVRAQLEEAVGVGLLESYTVTPPAIGSVASADRAARVLRNMRFGGIFAGAIHELELAGTLGY